MNGIITAARVLFIAMAAVLLIAAGYVVANRSEVNGSQALTVVLSAAAAIGAIASWNPRRSDP
jgi:ABC-type anion transport system duplicated permease subunit